MKMKNSIFYLSYRSNREKQNVIIQIRNFLWHWGHHLHYSQKEQEIFIDHMQQRTLFYFSADGQPPQAHGLQYSSDENSWQSWECSSGLQKGNPLLLIFLPQGSDKSLTSRLSTEWYSRIRCKWCCSNVSFCPVQ